jgi:hypothetical protein
MSMSKGLTSASKRCWSSLEATYCQSLNGLGEDPTSQIDTVASAALPPPARPLPSLLHIPRIAVQRVILAASCTPICHMQCNSQVVTARASRTPQLNGQPAGPRDSRRGRRRMLVPSFRDLLTGCPYTHPPCAKEPRAQKGAAWSGGRAQRLGTVRKSS